MSQANQIQIDHNSRTIRSIILILAFVLVAIAGLTYVKWWPYYHKAIRAIEEHNIGSSLLTGNYEGHLSWAAAWEYAGIYFNSIWKAAVLGIVLGSLIQVLIPSQWLERVLGKATFKSTVYGGIASIPGMMCSCCAAPIAASLRKRKVSIGASLAFWIGNPVLNPATLVFMTFVLSWKFTLIRLLLGVLLTFGVAYWANRLTSGDQPKDNPIPVPSTPLITTERGPFFLRWMRSLGLLTLQVVPAYVVTVLLLGALQGWMFPISIPNEALAILLFSLFGMLFVIPTAAEIPIISAFLALGVGIGPASALLLTLPAVSLPSLLMVSRSFPRKVLLFVAVSVVVVGVLSGLIGTWLL